MGSERTEPLEETNVDLTAAWHSVFTSWPESLPRAGILVTSTQDTIPFVDFLVAEQFVIVERDVPDSQGARKLLVALACLSAVKLKVTDELQTLSSFIRKP